MRRLGVALMCAAGILTAGDQARGQAHGQAVAPAPAPSAGPVEEAQRRFRAAIELYEDRDFDGAFVELKRAYELAPAYRILYNLGQVASQRRDHAAALDYFQRFLAKGGDKVLPARRAEVQAELAELRGRVGTLFLEGVPAGAEVLLDDAHETRSAVGSLIVNSGRRRIEIVAPNGERWARVIDVPGGDAVRVAVSLGGGPRALPAAAPPVMPPAALVLSAPRAEERSDAPTRRGRIPWLGWTATAATAVGAAVTGTLALRQSRELERSLANYPVMEADIADVRRDVRVLSLTTDALLVGAAVLGAVSAYLSFREPATESR